MRQLKLLTIYYIERILLVASSKKIIDFPNVIAIGITFFKVEKIVGRRWCGCLLLAWDHVKLETFLYTCGRRTRSEESWHMGHMTTGRITRQIIIRTQAYTYKISIRFLKIIMLLKISKIINKMILIPSCSKKSFKRHSSSNLKYI